jgi:hypothetical protein
MHSAACAANFFLPSGYMALGKHVCEFYVHIIYSIQLRSKQWSMYSLTFWCSGPLHFTLCDKVVSDGMSKLIFKQHSSLLVIHYYITANTIIIIIIILIISDATNMFV